MKVENIKSYEDGSLAQTKVVDFSFNGENFKSVAIIKESTSSHSPPYLVFSKNEVDPNPAFVDIDHTQVAAAYNLLKKELSESGIQFISSCTD